MNPGVRKTSRPLTAQKMPSVDNEDARRERGGSHVVRHHCNAGTALRQIAEREEIVHLQRWLQVQASSVAAAQLRDIGGGSRRRHAEEIVCDEIVGPARPTAGRQPARSRSRRATRRSATNPPASQATH
jgi:hypothetical protein